MHLLGRALILKKLSIQARKILFVERKASFYLRSREFCAFFSKSTKSWIARVEEDFYSSSPNKTSPSTCAYTCVRMHMRVCVRVIAEGKHYRLCHVDEHCTYLTRLDTRKFRTGRWIVNAASRGRATPPPPLQFAAKVSETGWKLAYN